MLALLELFSKNKSREISDISDEATFASIYAAYYPYLCCAAN